MPKPVLSLDAVRLHHAPLYQDETVVDFVIIAWAIFVAVKVLNRLKRAEPPAAPPTPPREEQLLTEIRDLLKQR